MIHGQKNIKSYILCLATGWNALLMLKNAVRRTILC